MIKEHTAYILTKPQREDFSACGIRRIDLCKAFFLDYFVSVERYKHLVNEMEVNMLRQEEG